MFKGTDLKLDDAESTFYFVRDFNKVAQFGNPFVYVKSKGGDNKEKSESKASLANKPTVLESINALVPADVTTKAEFQNRKVFNAVYAATEPGGAISNYVRSKSESKEVADKAMESVVDRLINYDPAAVRKKANGDPITFGEFIFANTNFGKLDARKSLAIEAKETARKVSIDSEQAKEIADKDTAADPRTSGKPKRMNLLTRRIVSPEAISKAKVVVERAVKGITTSFNQETSLNVTVKPYIAQLKKGFADKTLVKAVAQEMGNGGDLKSWMRKHKAAILDNMTTTYLIGAFPAAIQKQVKGTNTWTSDWAGKEIQREKTTTGSAGRTSGAFMVRRLPHASSKISDAEFVEMLFDSKGVIKPGKKPSLAKAIAEEIGFDIMSAEIKNPDGAIAKTFKNNQEGLGVVIADNYVAEMLKQSERGSAKFSVSGGIATLDDIQRVLFERKSDELLGWMDAHKGNWGKNYKGILGALKIIYADNQEISGNLEAIAKNLYAVVKPYNSKESIEKLDKELEGDFFTYLQQITSDFDFNETIATMAGSASVAKVMESAATIEEAKESLAESFQNLDPEIVLSFLNSTFANSGRVGKYVTENGVTTFDKSRTHRSDLWNNAAEALDWLKTVRPEVNWDNVKRPYAATAKINKAHLSKNPDVVGEVAKADAAWEFTVAVVKGMKNKSPEVQASIMASMNSGTNTALRVAAPAIFRSTVLPSKKTSDYRYEHAIPARVVLAMLYQHYIKGDKRIDPAALKKDYVVAIIPKAMDKVIGEVGFGQMMVPGYRPGLTPWYTRYFNALTRGREIYAIESLADGKVYGQSWADYYKNKNKVTIKVDAAQQNAQNAQHDIDSNKALSKLSISQEQDMSKAINDMIERTEGVQSEKVFSAVQAKKRGKIIGKYKFFSPAADDFRGLTSYTFAGKGRQGEADQKFFEEKLIKPYQRGINAIDVAKQTLKNDFTAVVKAFAPQAKVMKKKIPGSDYTYDQAIRVYMWTRQGTEVPGMSKRDLALLNKTVAEDPAMIAFADAMLLVSKQGEWMAPGEHWLTNTVLSDLNNMSEKIGRKVYLEEFLTNKDIIFSPENMAKIEAIYGSKYISALKDSLYRMENGTNRPSGEDATTNRWLNWINQSTGAIMFFNRRSAALQLLSTVNFINWSDNNPVKAAIAFANQKQFWTDFSMLFNSPKLKQRRAGLKTDVSQAEIANAVAGQTNKAAAVLNYLLKIGFTPTQIADSFAIASGGASFYRNRVNTYIKQGKSQKEAETLAFEEFSSTADESQQSSDPMLISQQQATMLGRLVLAFQNTTMQFSRLMKKSTLDLINGRGDPKTHISKIIYYGAVQNFVFSALQSALFSFIPGFGDDDEYDESKTREEKLEGATGRIINGMIDSVLRGTGLTGAVIATLKNAIMKYTEQEERGYNANHIYTFLAVLSIMPPVGSKFSKLYKAQQTKTFEKDALEARPFGIVADGRVNLGPGYRIVGNLAAATFSIPGDRIVDEVTSISEALDSRNSQWQRLALAIGYKAWAVGAKNEEHDLLKAEGKVRRKAEGKVKAAETRAANKETERERIANMSPAERSKYEEQKVLDKINKKVKKLENR
jgi:hypothetical protein